MIKLQDVRKHYRAAAKGELALRGVDLEIEEGEMVAIVGTSGSGKTTLLNIIGGLDRDFTGRVSVGDADLQTLSDAQLAQLRNQKIGFIFQHFSLLDHLTAVENVALPASFLKGASPVGDPRQRARETLTMLGLGDKLDARPNRLSGGQKQRVAIARALLFKPQLLLCDEPTGSLDSVTGEQIIKTFQDLNEEGYTVIIITHEDRVSDAAKRVIRIEDGRITDDGRARP
ncbi:ABC transporter ATP-binding protein [Myxococcota bacterium]|nr:ABC transporter ATP-binding protein [Myxococcota bacterium]MBU1430180.1 ABC transporter ATP-binding protein [Myxococcota bacterium]MBU1898594.1 ABC transporter ATP-binding protein [Myxococcota bacterium]